MSQIMLLSRPYFGRRHTQLIPAFLLIAIMVCTTAGSAEPEGSLVSKVTWKELAESKKLPASASLEPQEKGDPVLKVTRGPQDPQLIELAVVEKPGITKKAYVLRGKIKYAGVGGEGFLEMWNHFPEPKPGAYFSRSMDETGPMGKLRGDSPWRDFQLPFMITDATFPAPSKLQFNVYLPEAGTVWLTDMSLTEFPLEELQKQLQSSSAFLSWDTRLLFGVLAVFTVAFGIAIVGVWVARWRRNEAREHRRMQALDMGT